METVPPPRLPHPVRPEADCAHALLASIASQLDWNAVVVQAAPWIAATRAHPAPFWAMESLLKEYPISSAEGLALMRLAEALLRVPDTHTAMLLTADQLSRAEFEPDRDADHPWIAAISASAIALSKKFLPDEPNAAPGLIQRLGAHTVVGATVRAIQLLGRQFVLGETIDQALGRANDARKAAGVRDKPLVFSFDMLGEGARTAPDAQRYFAAYANAIDRIASNGVSQSPESSNGISIKLSALHPRYEEAGRARIANELVPRVMQLIDRAARANLNLTIDAEETERLELSLDTFETLVRHVARAHPQWHGFGLAVQAYQTRALATVEHVAALARECGVRLMVRLVKGAYWDAEIKRAQELGLEGYPVFTHKHHTDLSYLACAKCLLDAAPLIYPQFASHNAGTISAVLALARSADAPFELQRLHGMGEGVYREVLRDSRIACRVYAPVGEHRDLLAYLVRRLLENGANSSFVHQLADPSIAVADLLESPFRVAPRGAFPLPGALYGAERRNSAGVDLTSRQDRPRYAQAVAHAQIAPVREATREEAGEALRRARAAQPAWSALGAQARGACLERAAESLEARMPEFVGLLVCEAHKTWGDAVAEVREAVDFCRYYAVQARKLHAPYALPGPTGESNVLELHGRGAFVCISPWNFPLAIFCGQVAAALATGNAVVAKPAEQTPAVAAACVALLHDAGVPQDVLRMLHGPGETIGTALVDDPHCAGVAFTGSTGVAKAIARALASKDGPIVPLIAETGGINAMIVDSTALPEQVADAVVTSCFRSAGQRCSALRLLCVQDDIADALIAMIAGAVAELAVGDPSGYTTDVGPVIDAEAHASIAAHVARLEREARLVARAPLGRDALPNTIAPVAFEVARVRDVRDEIFGPVLHIVRFKAWGLDALIDDINALGYGLTLGVQTRIDARAADIAKRVRAGNVYVNRSMIGAVVGMQPFGGEGLSGTGPKAGGPYYLPRFCAEKTVTINTAAAGGNAALLAGEVLAA